MPWVRVKKGLNHGAGGKHPGGTLLEVTEEEALAFADKFDEAEPPKKRTTRRKRKSATKQTASSGLDAEAIADG